MGGDKHSFPGRGRTIGEHGSNVRRGGPVPGKPVQAVALGCTEVAYRWLAVPSPFKVLDQPPSGAYPVCAPAFAP